MGAPSRREKRKPFASRHWPRHNARLARCHRSDAPCDLVPRRCHLQHRQPLGHVLGHRVHALTAHVHAHEAAKQGLGFSIWLFRSQRGHRLLHVELETPGCSAHDLVEGVHPTAAGPTIKRRPGQLDRSHHSLHGVRDGRAHRQEPITRGTAGLLSRGFPTMGVLDDRFRQAAGERLAQVPHRLGHLR
jgi:hypothetical protein